MTHGSARTGADAGYMGSDFVGSLSNAFVAEAVALGVERVGEPLVSVLFGPVGAGVFGHALHHF